MVDIIICSSSDISQKEAKELNLLYAPLQVNMDGNWYYDGVDLSYEEFNSSLETIQSIPTTSQVSPYIFEELYKQVKEEAVVITCSKEISGTYQSAMIARDGYTNIYIVDSTMGSIAERLLIQEACKLRDEGYSAKKIVEKLNQTKENLCLLFVLDTLKFASKGGRLSKTQVTIGNLIKVKPVLAMHSGKIEFVGIARSSKKVGKLLLTYVKEHGGIDFTKAYCCAYSGTDQSIVYKYIENSQIILEEEINNTPIYQTGSVIGSHAGPRAVLFAYSKLPITNK